MTVAVPLVMPASVKVAVLAAFYRAARKYVMLAVVEFCHDPHGRTDGDKGVVERRVENRRQLLDQRIGFCDGGAFRGIVPDRAGQCCV